MEKQECVLVKQPEWWNDESGNSSGFWVLDRCLPGQRNAASRFFDFLDAHLSGLGFESSPLLPSLFRHKNRNLVVCSHVDDLIIGGERGDAAWLMEELEKKFTLSGGVLIPTSDQNPMEPVRFLKKRHFLMILDTM